MINQIGFMVVGIGIGTPCAVNGAISNAFNDVIFKGLLFMSMEAVLYRPGRINGSDLGGLYKSMPWTTVSCIPGASSISAFPICRVTTGFDQKWTPRKRKGNFLAIPGNNCCCFPAGRAHVFG